MKLLVYGGTTLYKQTWTEDAERSIHQKVINITYQTDTYKISRKMPYKCVLLYRHDQSKEYTNTARMLCNSKVKVI